MIPRKHAGLFFYSFWLIVFTLMVAVRAGPWVFPGPATIEPTTYAAQPRRTPAPTIEPTSTPIATPTPIIATPTPVIAPTPAPTPVPDFNVQEEVMLVEEEEEEFFDL